MDPTCSKFYGAGPYSIGNTSRGQFSMRSISYRSLALPLNTNLVQGQVYTNTDATCHTTKTTTCCVSDGLIKLYCSQGGVV